MEGMLPVFIGGSVAERAPVPSFIPASRTGMIEVDDVRMIPIGSGRVPAAVDCPRTLSMATILSGHFSLTR